MRLTKSTGYNKAPEKIPQPLTDSERALFQYNLSMDMPSGKYQGKTARYVKSTDSNYWLWCETNGKLIQWGIQILRTDAMEVQIKKVVGFYASNGEIWISLIEHSKQ